MGRRRATGGGLRGTRVYQAVERALLSFGMGVVAFFIERRLLKAIKTGGVKPAPRTLAERDEYFGGVSGESPDNIVPTASPQAPAG